MIFQQLFSLNGKVAVLIGASQGIGSEMAKILAEAGARLALVARNQEKLASLAVHLTEAGHEAMAFSCDVTRVEEVDALMERIHHHFGQIDILVNNAGMNIAKPIEEVTESDWDSVLDLNLKSAFFCSQAAGRYMVPRKQGKIVNISSQMALVGYYKRSAYCASKGGLMQMTKAMAIEWSSSKINVNSIAPTFIETPMTAPMFEDPSFRAEVLSRIPLGRLAKAEDLFGALIFLCSSSSDMVTGQTIVVDGGWTVW
ncbi:SDR family NAD(P)-dependent oxidoreductase [Paenibacillus periandrae]|uniref:SDR family NAD(P)-dependent oxidoreductase n=1 Tax=Paenibacillus periandrae TaxID=1761741 RepID=UPI001F09A95D|nr:glucose 1-dehydrogenase [Paenibacillus periandrae]